MAVATIHFHRARNKTVSCRSLISALGWVGERKGNIDKVASGQPRGKFPLGYGSSSTSPDSNLQPSVWGFVGIQNSRARGGGNHPGMESSRNLVSIRSGELPGASFPHDFMVGEELNRHLWSWNLDTWWPFPTEELTLGLRSSDIPYVPPETKWPKTNAINLSNDHIEFSNYFQRQQNQTA